MKTAALALGLAATVGAFRVPAAPRMALERPEASVPDKSSSVLTSRGAFLSTYVSSRLS